MSFGLTQFYRVFSYLTHTFEKLVRAFDNLVRNTFICVRSQIIYNQNQTFAFNPGMCIFRASTLCHQKLKLYFTVIYCTNLNLTFDTLADCVPVIPWLKMTSMIRSRVSKDISSCFRLREFTSLRLTTFLSIHQRSDITTQLDVHQIAESDCCPVE